MIRKWQVLTSSTLSILIKFLIPSFLSSFYLAALGLVCPAAASASHHPMSGQHIEPLDSIHLNSINKYMPMTVMYRTNNMRSIWHYPYPCHGSQLLGTPAVSTGPFLARCIAELIGMSVPFSSACVVANVIEWQRVAFPFPSWYSIVTMYMCMQ